MQDIKALLQKSLSKAGITKQVEASLIVVEAENVLQQIMGSHILDHAKPLYVKNQVLYVAVLSSVVATELTLHKRAVIQILQRKFGALHIIDLKCVV